MTTINQTVRNHRGLLLVGSLLIPVLTALLLGAGGKVSVQLAQNRLEIEQMTPSQRAQLQRRLDDFRQMPVEEQQRYRDLHRHLQTDDNAVTLRVTLDRYRNWLKTISPFEREELQAIENLDQRVERVKQLMAQQSTPETLADDDPRLSQEDLAAMLNVIAEELAIPATELDGKTDWQRHMLVLNRLVESRREQIRPNDWTSVFDEDLFNKMTAALPAGDFHTAINGVRFKNEKRRIVARNILEYLGRQVADKLANTQPTKMELRQLAFRMPPGERDRYEELESQAEKDQFLLSRVRMKRVYETMKPYPALQRTFFHILSPRRGGPPPRGYPGRGGRDFDQDDPEMKRRPPERNGSPRGFRPGEKRKRFDGRRPPREPGE